MFEIQLLPDNKNISIQEESTILEALQTIDIHILASCGGKQLCGECKVRILTETPTP